MNLVDDLARVCVAAREKRAFTPGPSIPSAGMTSELPELRNQFESSVTREELLRRHADRLNELAASRASEEDTSPGGYAETIAKRLVPVPHTTGEAAVRLPAMALGGMYGHHAALPFETPPPEMIQEVLSEIPAKGMRESPLATRLTAHGVDAGKADKLRTQLSAMRPEHVHGALQPSPLPIFGRAQSGAARGKITKALGEQGPGILRQEIGGLKKFKGKLRWGGAAAGALAGGMASGLPFIIRALLAKRHGGEAAERARGEAKQVVGKAEHESKSREEILQKAEASGKKPNSGTEKPTSGSESKKEDPNND